MKPHLVTGLGFHTIDLMSRRRRLAAGGCGCGRGHLEEFPIQHLLANRISQGREVELRNTAPDITRSPLPRMVNNSRQTK